MFKLIVSWKDENLGVLYVTCNRIIQELNRIRYKDIENIEYEINKVKITQASIDDFVIYKAPEYTVIKK